MQVVAGRFGGSPICVCFGLQVAIPELRSESGGSHGDISMNAWLWASNR